MSIVFSPSQATSKAAPPFTTSTYISNNVSIIIRFASRNNKNVRGTIIGMSANNNNDNVDTPLWGSLFVPSQLSVSKLPQRQKYYGWSEEDDSEYYDDWKHYLSQSSIKTKSGSCLSLPLSKIMLIPAWNYMDSHPCNYDFFPDKPFYKPFYDGPIAVIEGGQYLSLKDKRLFMLPQHGGGDIISSLGHSLICYCTSSKHLYRLNLRSRVPYHFRSCRTDPDYIGCHSSNPLLADIEKRKKKKDRLVLHRFAVSSPDSLPWDCILMAIDKSRGYLVYTSGHDKFIHHPDCWIVLDSMRNYTTGDLLYFKKDGNFYVLPNAQSGHLEVWRFQDYICSKESEINAKLLLNKDKSSYHHIHSYLVESLDGNILLVRRYVAAVEDFNDNNFFKTGSFEVLKLNFDTKQWEVVPSLGDDEALFVGSNNSFSLSSNRYPEVIPNCIYFTDQICCLHGGKNNMLHGKDNGIFHLEDCTFTPIFDAGLEFTQGPVWLRPEDEECCPHAYLN